MSFINLGQYHVVKYTFSTASPILLPKSKNILGISQFGKIIMSAYGVHKRYTATFTTFPSWLGSGAFIGFKNRPRSAGTLISCLF
jgi:hypothetical protein